MTEFSWRAMTSDDVDGVVSVATAAFPDHFEERACFEERLALFPLGCFVLAAGDAVMGYMIAYPWPYGEVPRLNTLIGELPEVREAVYLHDLALRPEMRGQGYSRPIVERLIREARLLGVSRIALVSVNDTVPFWQSLGFEVVAGEADLGLRVQTYGEHSIYMSRKL
jgi:GNAT superfamily N-acetyltransferase